MTIKSHLFLVFSFILVQGKDFDVILKLDSDEIINSLTSKTSLKYLNELAEIFAKKAAEFFVEEVKKKKHLMENKGSISSNEMKQRNSNRTRPKLTHDIMNDEEAFKLLEDPSPDGDNLDVHSYVDSIEESLTGGLKSIPVYGMMKVNGVYVRRLLDRLR